MSPARNRITAGRARAAITTALIAASALAALALAPAASAAPAVEALQYKGDRPSGKKLLFNRAGLKLESSCEDPYGVYLYVTTGPGTSTSISGLDRTGSETWDPRFLALGEGSEVGINTNRSYLSEIVHTTSEGKMLIVDGLHQVQAFGRDCSWSGTVRTVPAGDQIRRSIAAGDAASFESGPVDYTANCGSETRQLVMDSVPRPSSIGADFNDSDDLWDAKYFAPGVGAFPLATIDADATILDVVLAESRGVLSTLRGVVAKQPGGDCVVRFAERPRVSKGASRAYLNSKPSRKSIEILDLKGLKLTATCDAETLAVFARSAVNSAAVSSRSARTGNFPFAAGTADLDRGKKVQLAQVIDQETTGHLVYARPDGRVVTMNWGARQTENARKPCQFGGLATSG